MDHCEMIDFILEDESYAVYFNLGGFPKFCPNFYNCKAVVTPFVVNTIPGGEWMFPKRSPFFAIFNHYFIELEAMGIFKRIMESWDDESFLPYQECPQYEGAAIKMDKLISLFLLISGGIGLSVLIFL